MYLEDVRATITGFDKLRALFGAASPAGAPRAPTIRPRSCSPRGRKARPKGVVLSHRNMLANVAQVAARIDFGRTDKVFDVLPLFHSFGLTAALVLPLVSGVQVYLYPSPLHYRIVPELIYGTNCHRPVRHRHVPGRLRALRQRLRPALAPLRRGRRRAREGDDPADLSRKIRPAHPRGLWRDRDRARAGPQHADVQPLRHGRPDPARHGGAARAGAGDRGRRAAVGSRAQRHARLPEGRASRRAGTRPKAGWHDTGDIVDIDAEGFVTIKGRAKRFAKIGGEMVSLAAVEALRRRALARMRPRPPPTAPDARKGERIVLVTTEKNGDTGAPTSPSQRSGTWPTSPCRRKS